MNDYIEARAKEVAQYMVDNQSTIRETAKKFGWSKSTIQKDLRDRLCRIDPVLYKRASEVLDNNKAERSMRAVMAAKKKR